MPRRPILLLALSALLAATCRQTPAAPQDPVTGLTFFGWSDQHIQTSGDGKHLEPAIDAMNALPGRDFPAGIGGKVAKPAFVIGLGDITEWPTAAARDTYDRLLAKRLQFPAYDVLGNHDSGGNVPSETLRDWVRKRHGGLSYVFEKGGVRFLMVHSEFDANGEPAQPITAEALAWIRAELARTPKGRPVVVATHLCLDAITNRDAFVDAFGEANVVLVLGGHYHKATVGTYRDKRFVQLPSPQPGWPREVTVIRITPDRLVAIPFDYQKNAWTDDQKKILDVRLKPAK